MNDQLIKVALSCLNQDTTEDLRLWRGKGQKADLRQGEILNYVLKGRNNEYIANKERLKSSEATVHIQRTVINAKFEVFDIDLKDSVVAARVSYLLEQIIGDPPDFTKWPEKDMDQIEALFEETEPITFYPSKPLVLLVPKSRPEPEPEIEGLTEEEAMIRMTGQGYKPKTGPGEPGGGPVEGP